MEKITKNVIFFICLVYWLVFKGKQLFNLINIENAVFDVKMNNVT